MILCGDHGQPPPFSGESAHRWLKEYVDYYEEMSIDRRSLDKELAELKSKIRCTDDNNQGLYFREVIPKTSFVDFISQWKSSDIVVASRKTVRDVILRRLFKIYQNKFPSELVLLCYRPNNTRLQNILVDIPNKNEVKDQQELVLNDIVLVDINVVEDALNMINSPWQLGYAATIHSSQGLTITDTIVWTIDDFIEWDNLSRN